MKRILIFGAGLSSSSLIRYLLHHAKHHHWEIVVADQDDHLVKKKIGGHKYGKALCINALDQKERWPEIEKSDLVISMLPARFHVAIAEDCIALKKDLITPSYVSKEMQHLHDKALKSGVLIMNEIGVDPGIDHMSAMKIIHKIQKEGGTLEAFRSYCGGLIAPESDDNPWNYKFTWNPRNVILAGQGGVSCYLDHHEYKYIPYHRLFLATSTISVNGFGTFEAYANRDALSYREIYGLSNLPTIFRGTLRRPGFCEAWNIFIALGMTDDSFQMQGSEKLTPRDFLNAFLPFHPDKTVEEKFQDVLGSKRATLYPKFKWLGLFENQLVMGIKNASPAQLLESLLKTKLALKKEDKDMLVMHHEFEYSRKGNKYKVYASMVNIGEDQTYTSMSNTVGLPIAIAAKMILQGKIKTKGVQLPVDPATYEPILEELSNYGISFLEKQERIA